MINFIYYVLRDGFRFARLHADFEVRLNNDITEEQKLKKIAPGPFSLGK